MPPWECIKVNIDGAPLDFLAYLDVHVSLRPQDNLLMDIFALNLGSHMFLRYNLHQTFT